ncbi:unnamed protein product, partial [Mesorhabditis belari]|uniref:F-box domain-containing protein n=1 Tax=Mesorhabditis belari TaxID=2138241 RepID=A0AAF3EI26_9BILA
MALPQQNGPLDPGKLEGNQGKVWNESPVPPSGIGIDPQSDFLSPNEPPPPYFPDQTGATVLPGPIVVIAQPTCSTVDAELEACRRNKSKRYRHDSTCSMVETETHCLLCCCFGPRCSGGGGCCSGGCNCGGCTCSGGGGGGGDGKAGLILLVVLVLFLGEMSDKPESSKTQLKGDIIESLFQKDFLSQLPEEIAFHIIAYLPPCDLMVCAGVSRTWQRICEDDRTWRQKCLEQGYVEFDAPSFRFLGGWATNRANEEAGITIFSQMDLQAAHQNRREREIAYGQCFERSPWKSLYLRKQRIISNWRSRAIQSSTVLKGHDEHEITCLEIHSGHVVTSSDDNKLRVWNVDDAELAFTLTGHMGDIWTILESDDGKYIFSGSSDQTVRVWCGQTGAQLHVLQGHTDTVTCMSLQGTTLVSGSDDGTLRVWDIVDGKCLHILTGHLEEVWCVQFDGIRVVSSAADFTVKVWNVQTGECLHTLTGHTSTVDSLLFDPDRDLVVSESRDRTIRVWDVRRGTCVAILDTHKSSRSDMGLQGNHLVFCNADSGVQVWDIRDGGSCIHRLHGRNGHTSGITSLQLLDSGLLVTSSYDGSVKLWDLEKGIFVRDLLRLQADRL